MNLLQSLGTAIMSFVAAAQFPKVMKAIKFKIFPGF